MKVNYSIFGNATGSLGGSTASHNTYGPYWRKRVRPVNPNTANQNTARLALSNTAQSWGQLTDEQRQAWITAAPLFTRANPIGGSQALTGQALFMSLNSFRARLNFNNLLVPPTTPSTPTISTPGVNLLPPASVGVSQIELLFDSGDAWNVIKGGVILSISALLPAGRVFTQTPYGLGAQGIVQGPLATATIQPPYDTRAGGRVRIAMRAQVPDGNLSVQTFVDAILPQQAIVEDVAIVGSELHLTFSRSVDAADFAAGDLTNQAVAATAVNQVSDAVLAFPFAAAPVSGDSWVLTPSGTAADYTPPQAGLVP